MADLSKLKRKNSLGSPPSMSEASKNLNATEILVEKPQPKVIDGRSARRSNRTLQFATRVKPEWDRDLRYLAQRDGLLLVEVLEKALELYKSR